jgi:guanylate kinase
MSAPSGAGKSTILSGLLASVRDLRFSVSHTTRRPRLGERGGIDYHFVDEGDFQSLIATRRFLEWARVHDAFYGTSLDELENARSAGMDLLLDVDVQGASQVRAKMPDVTSVFILPPSYAVLEARIRRRGHDSEDTIRRRLERAAEEVKHYKEYDYVLVNDDLDWCVSAFRAVIEASRHRAARQEDRARSILESFEKRQGT